jgi:hypothetical protein
MGTLPARTVPDFVRDAVTDGRYFARDDGHLQDYPGNAGGGRGRQAGGAALGAGADDGGAA